MRKEKALIQLLNGLVKILAEESDRNPAFAGQLDELLDPIPARTSSRRERAPRVQPQNVPDIHAEFTTRGEHEFRIWLGDQPVPVLRSLIRLHDFDAARRTSKWKDPEKLSSFIADQIRSRLSRGAGFLSTSGTDAS
jgi:hypothetical protein